MVYNLWAIVKTVLLAKCLFIILIINSSTLSSILAVGSSIKTIGDYLNKARPIDINYFSPKDKLSPF